MPFSSHTPDDLLILSVADSLELEVQAQRQEHPLPYWNTPKGQRESILRPLTHARDFLLMAGRNDLLDTWLHERFQRTVRSSIPWLDPSASADPSRRTYAEATLSTWREFLGVPTWIQELTHYQGGSTVLQELFNTPGGLDWGLQALRDGAKITSPAALARAIHEGREDAVQALLAAGIDPNGPEHIQACYQLPLQMSVRKTVPDHDAIQRRIRETLVKAGADVNRLNGVQSCLFQAAIRQDVPEVRWLLEQGADPFVRWTHQGQTFEIVPTLQAQGIPAEVVDLIQTAQKGPAPMKTSPRRRSP